MSTCMEKTTLDSLLQHPSFSKMLEGAQLLLAGLNEVTGSTLDLQVDENFIDTPKRIAKAYVEMSLGLAQQEEVKAIFKTSFPSEYTGMITVDNIDASSLCPHHFLPVKYNINFSYIPQERMLGLSKIPRFIKILAKRPVLQEQFTKEIIDTFVKEVQPKGCIVTVTGVHNCMVCRGVQTQNSSALTSEVYGSFEDLDTRLEFFEMLKLRNAYSTK